MTIFAGWKEISHSCSQHNIPTVIPGSFNEDVSLSRLGHENLGPEDSPDIDWQAQQYWEIIKAYVSIII